MSMKTVTQTLLDCINNDSVLAGYLNRSEIGFKDNFPRCKYMAIIEPANQKRKPGVEVYNNLAEVVYSFEIYVRLDFANNTDYSIMGINDKIGLLDFTDDVLHALKEDTVISSYNKSALSESSENASSSFNLSGTEKFISVIIDGKTPAGFNEVLCGDTSGLTGTNIASNIESSLKSLSAVNNLYSKAICSFNNVTNKFTVALENNNCPSIGINITAGNTNDCSDILGFTSPTETNGKNIVNVQYNDIIANNDSFPIRFRIINIDVYEELIV